MRSLRAFALAASAAAVLSLPGRASARAQNSVSGQLGVVGVGGERAWERTRLNVGVRFESIWFREDPRHFGVGPFVEARTASFGHADYGGGLVALIPVDPTFPIWLGGGGFARRDDGAWAGGYNAFVAWGARSFNHHGSYAMAYGLLLDARVHRGPAAGVDVVLTASIDLQWLSYPWLYLISALRH